MFDKFSVHTEIFSLTELETPNSKAKSTIIDIELPTSMLINGIAITWKDAATCLKSEIGK